MSYQASLERAKEDLRRAQALILEEIQSYPTPISGCDAQYNHLIGQRGSVADALRALEAPKFVATPRTLEPGAGVESR